MWVPIPIYVAKYCNIQLRILEQFWGITTFSRYLGTLDKAPRNISLNILDLLFFSYYRCRKYLPII